MSKLLEQVAKNVEKQSGNIRSKLKTVINAFINNCEISAQEIALHVLQIKMCKCSTGEVFICTSPHEKREKMKKGRQKLEEIREKNEMSTDWYEKSSLDHYIDRPDELENTCLADFAALWTYTKSTKKLSGTSVTNVESEISDDNSVCSFSSDNLTKRTCLRTFALKGENSGFVKERNIRRIIRYRNYKQLEDEQNFFREHLMLYVPWRTEPSLQDTTLQLQFLEHQNTIITNRSHYCKYELQIHDLEMENNIDSENDEESVPSNKFKIYELENTEADIGLDLPENKKSDFNDKINSKFLLPKLIPENEFLSLIRTLNDKQRRYLLNLMHIIKTKPDEQYFHFITGGAGVGKSTLITAISQCTNRYWIHQIHNSSETIKLVMTAPTGKAASKVKGVTLHYALQWGSYNLRDICLNIKVLNSDKRNTLQCLYRDVLLFIIDEISLCGAHMLWAINNTLQQVFENKLPFGNIRGIILCGDFQQCPPVNDCYAFEIPKNTPSLLAGQQLWSLFKLFELTEIMRQKDDLKYATALNNLAIGCTTEDDDNLFKSREMATLHVELYDIIEKVTALYHANTDVDTHNTLYLSLMQSEKAISPAIDQCTGPGNERSREYMIKTAQSLHHKKTQNLHTMLRLIIGAKYNITQNIAVPDGIANGSSCKLEKIIWGELRTENTTLIPIRVYVTFDDPNAGDLTRNAQRETMLKDKANHSWTPIDRINRTFTVTAGSLMSVTRNQIPMSPSAASTIHSAQSTTCDELMVSVKGLTRKLLYTALSRGTKAEGLYIAGEYKPPKKATIENDSTFRELHRMRNESLLNFSLLFPEDFKTRKNHLCIFHNVRSLNLHFRNITSSKSFTSSDIIMLAETWTLPRDCYLIDDFYTVHRTDCITPTRHAFGTLIFAKKAIKTKLKIIYEEQMIETNGHTTVVALSLSNSVIILAYRSPNATTSYLFEYLKTALSITSKSNFDNTFILGDMNIKYQKGNKGYSNLLSFMLLHNMYFSLKTSDITTDYDSLLDLCFSSNIDFKANIFESVTSDHKPIWFIF